jgi:hypothetical protein
LDEELAGRSSTTPPIGCAQRDPTVPAYEAADDFVAFVADDQPVPIQAVKNARPDLRVRLLLAQNDVLAGNEREYFCF